MREASQKSTSASVASASVRTPEPVLEEVDRVDFHRARPTSPKATNTIAGVIGVPASRPETAAKPSTASARSASVHSLIPLSSASSATRGRALEVRRRPRPLVDGRPQVRRVAVGETQRADGERPIEFA